MIIPPHPLGNIPWALPLSIRHLLNSTPLPKTGRLPAIIISRHILHISNRALRPSNTALRDISPITYHLNRVMVVLPKAMGVRLLLRLTADTSSSRCFSRKVRLWTTTADGLEDTKTKTNRPLLQLCTSRLHLNNLMRECLLLVPVVWPQVSF